MIQKFPCRTVSCSIVCRDDEVYHKVQMNMHDPMDAGSGCNYVTASQLHTSMRSIVHWPKGS